MNKIDQYVKAEGLKVGIALVEYRGGAANIVVPFGESFLYSVQRTLRIRNAKIKISDGILRITGDKVLSSYIPEEYVGRHDINKYIVEDDDYEEYKKYLFFGPVLKRLKRGWYDEKETTPYDMSTNCFLIEFSDTTRSPLAQFVKKK
jgi:hypothetical protein